jgi:hypothetical protein
MVADEAGVVIVEIVDRGADQASLLQGACRRMGVEVSAPIVISDATNKCNMRDVMSQHLPHNPPPLGNGAKI